MIGQQTLDFGFRKPGTVKVLGSSSSGNATLVRADGTALLVDCGLGPRYTARALKTEGLTLEPLSGVVVTHTHSDHIRAECRRTGRVGPKARGDLSRGCRADDS